MSFLEKLNEKRGILTIIGVIALMLVVYFLVKNGTSNLFQGSLDVDEEPPPLAFDIPDEDPEEPADPPNDDAPPEVEFTGFNDEEDPDDPEDPPEDPDDPEDPPQNNEKVEITDHDVFPKGFNPLTSETKISYEISGDAEIELKITDEAGKTIVTLVDDENLDEGEYFIVWNGTDSTTNDGKVVSPGKYFYKIRAKDPQTSQLEDSESGSINVAYATVAEDFENLPPQQPQQTQQTQTPVSTQNAATVSVQSATSGTTVGTGPEIAIYAILPFVGYFLTRRKND